MSKTTDYVIEALREYAPNTTADSNMAALGIAVKAYTSKYSNNQELGAKVRELINSFNEIRK